MVKLKKRLAAAGLVLALSMATVLPVMAGSACPACGGTRTESLSN